MMDVISIWTDTPQRWLEDIRREAEKIKEIESKLIAHRGAIAQFKWKYIHAVLSESKRQYYFMRSYQARIEGIVYFFTNVEIDNDGECYLYFHKKLKSGRKSKDSIRLSFDKVKSIEWLDDTDQS